MTNDTAEPQCVLTLERESDAPLEEVRRCCLGGASAQCVRVPGEQR